MTTPASAGKDRARNAMPGVVMISAEWTSAPADCAPASKAASIQEPDSLVSRPVTIRGRCPFFSAR